MNSARETSNQDWLSSRIVAIIILLALPLFTLIAIETKETIEKRTSQPLQIAEGVPEQKALFILGTSDIASMNYTLRFISRNGGRIQHVFPPNLAIGMISPQKVSRLIGKEGISDIVFGEIEVSSPSLPQLDKGAQKGLELWNKYIKNPPKFDQVPLEHKDRVIIPDKEDYFPVEPPQFLTPTRQTQAPNDNETSLFLEGKVAVGVFLPQCDGSRETCTESWTEEEKDQVLAALYEATEFYTSQELRAKLSFVYELHTDITTGYEPIRHYSDVLFVDDILGKLGYKSSNPTREYLADLRKRKQTDWAVSIWFIDHSPNNSPGYAWASLGGPFQFVPLGMTDYGGFTVAHELVHQFWGADEYPHSSCNPTTRYGYLGIPNANCASGGGGAGLLCLMGGGDPMWANEICTYTRGQIGWVDSGSNDILDPIDTTAHVVDLTSTISEGRKVFSGTAYDEPWPVYKPKTPSIPERSVTINYICNVQYKKTSENSWQNASPVDGSFDADVEEFTFTVDESAAESDIQTQAINCFSDGTPVSGGEPPDEPPPPPPPEDVEPPVVTISSPQKGSLVKDILTVQAGATDNVGVLRVDFYVDEVVIGGDTSAPYSVDWDTTAVTNGTYSLLAKAYDEAGNEGVSSQVVVRVENISIPPPVDDENPEVELTNPQDGDTVSGTVNIEAQASDNVGVVKVDLYVDGERVGEDLQPPYGASWNTTDVQDGVHALFATADDEAGNRGVSLPIGVEVFNGEEPPPPPAEASLNFKISNWRDFPDNINVIIEATDELGNPVAGFSTRVVANDAGEGNVNLEGLDVGKSYYFFVRGTKHLRKRYPEPITVQAGENPPSGVLDFGELIVGDYNRDNQITIDDLKAFLGNYGKSVPPADERLDFNEDKFINLVDLVAAGTNYGKNGD